VAKVAKINKRAQKKIIQTLKLIFHLSELQTRLPAFTLQTVQARLFACFLFLFCLFPENRVNSEHTSDSL
jgi:hypothetical protein